MPQAARPAPPQREEIELAALPATAPELARGESAASSATLRALPVLAAAVIFATAALTSRSLALLVDAHHALSQTRAAERSLQALTVRLLDTENAADRQLLGGAAAAADPDPGAPRELARARAELRRSLIGVADASPRLAEIDRAIDARLVELDRGLRLQSEGRGAEALESARAGRGKLTREAARAALGALAANEAARIQTLQQRHNDAVRGTYLSFAISTALNLVLLVALVWRMRVSGRHALAAREAMAQRNLELARALSATAARNEQAGALSELSRFLQSCADAPDAVGVLWQRLPRLMRAASGALYLAPQPRAQLRLAFSWGEPGFVAFFEPQDCWALRRNQPVRQPPDGGAAACLHLLAGHADVHGGLQCLPLTAYGETLGLLVLDLPTLTDAAAEAQAERERMTIVEQVALALGNLRLRESLRQQSIRDPLTGLYNRRFLEESVRRELVRGQRRQDAGGAGVALLMIDIDHFKSVNDDHGHEVGDEVLRAVAQLLQQFTRGSDVAARYGGEEFTLVLAEITPEQAMARAEQLRARVEALALNAGGRPIGAVTVSIGVASADGSAATLSALLQAADKALYQAKHAGRNRVVRYASS